MAPSSQSSATSKASSILVTGGCGFIGTHLVRALADQGRKVTVVDLNPPRAVVPSISPRLKSELSEGRDGASTLPGGLQGSHPAPALDSVSFNQGDIYDRELLRSALIGVEAVYHLAAVVSVPLCNERPAESTRTNLFGTFQVLEAVREEQKRSGRKIRVFFAGSSAVYGDGLLPGESASESSGCGVLASLYAVQKMNSERLLRLASSKGEIPSLIFRFFNVYGPGQDPNSAYSGVISKFVKNARLGLPLELQGGGLQTRDFIAVQDIVAACCAALDVPLEICSGQAVNLGTGRSRTVRDLAKTVCELVGSSENWVEAPARAGDVLHSQANIDLAKKLLNWKPSIDLKTGLKAYLSSTQDF